MDQSGFEPAHRLFFTRGQSLSLTVLPGRPPVTRHPRAQFIPAATPMWPEAKERRQVRIGNQQAPPFRIE